MAKFYVPSSSYPTVQSAIDAITVTTSTSYIYVYGGVYNENIIVNKDNVKIYPKDSHYVEYVGNNDIGIKVEANSFVMKDIVFKNYKYSLVVSGEDAYIENCIFSNNYCGVNSNSETLKIYRSTFENNIIGLEIGGSENKIINNYFEDNKNYGIFNKKISLNNSDIHFNYINNSKFGIYILNDESKENSIYMNNINNSIYGIYIKGTNNIIECNCVDNIDVIGMYLSGVESLCEKNSINGCNIGMLNSELNPVFINNSINFSKSYAISFYELGNMTNVYDNILIKNKYAFNVEDKNMLYEKNFIV